MQASSSKPGTTRTRKGDRLYKMGCTGPTTYNACSTVRWNEESSLPIQSGHGCIGCFEDGFWGHGSVCDRLANIKHFGVEANAETVGMAAAGVVGGAGTVHAAISALKRAQTKTPEKVERRGHGDHDAERLRPGYCRSARVERG